MFADSHFVIGQLHTASGQPCQDYALTGGLDGGSGRYAVVADGCSSGDRTDIGARLEALATAEAIRRTPRDAHEIGLYRQFVRQTSAGLLGCAPADLLATCLYAVVTPQFAYANVVGDGVLALQLTDGQLHLTRWDWDDNLPCYPCYAADGYAGFIQAHGGDPQLPRLTQTVVTGEPDGALSLPRVERLTLAQGIAGITLPLASVRYAALMSDGVTQIDGLEWTAAACELLAYKTTSGAFVKRRLRGFCKSAQSRGRGPLDDLACAVIGLEGDHHEAEPVNQA